MANRHRAQARASGGRTFYAGGGSEAAKAVTAKHGFAKGGKAELGRAAGGRAKGRGDFARGGRLPRASGGSVMSSAHGGLGGSGGHAGAANAKRGGKYASGGKVAEYAKGGKVAQKLRRGGECKEEDGEDGEEEEEARGGMVARHGGMHYVGGGGRKKRADGGKAETANPDEFESLSPGMRREILRSGRHWDEFKHAAPAKGKYQGTYGPDAEKRADGGGNWISGAIKHKGALHKSLGVPEGEKIPAKKLSKAAHSDNPTTARRAKLAETLKGLH